MNPSQHISLASVIAYCEANGWKRATFPKFDGITIFRKGTRRATDIVLPMSADDVDDFPDVISIAAKVLSRELELPVSRIIFDLKNASVDCLRFRVQGLQPDLDWLPLDFGRAFMESMEDSVLASTCSIVSPKTHHPRLGNRYTEGVLDVMKLGQTEVGSFVFTISCPTRVESVEEVNAKIPLGRQTFSYLMRGVSSLVKAIDSGRTKQLVRESKNSQAPLVSSNLCFALAKMWSPQLKNSLTIEASWSPTEASLLDESPSKVEIKKKHFEAIEEIAVELEDSPPTKENTFYGTVEKLEGEQSKVGRSGVIVLALMLPDQRPVRAYLRLGVADYKKAIRAHTRVGTYVKVRGILHPGRQPRLLDSITEFGIAR